MFPGFDRYHGPCLYCINQKSVPDLGRIATWEVRSEALPSVDSLGDRGVLSVKACFRQLTLGTRSAAAESV